MYGIRKKLPYVLALLVVAGLTVNTYVYAQSPSTVQTSTAQAQQVPPAGQLPPGGGQDGTAQPGPQGPPGGPQGAQQNGQAGMPNQQGGQRWKAAAGANQADEFSSRGGRPGERPNGAMKPPHGGHHDGSDIVLPLWIMTGLLAILTGSIIFLIAKRPRGRHHRHGGHHDGPRQDDSEAVEVV